jgi:hypothetical protein
MEMNDDKWVPDEETEDEYDSDVTMNETPLPEVDKEFRESVLKAKHSLYDNIVLAPELGTQDAQNPKIIVTYMANLNNFYELSKRAQTRADNNNIDLSVFPEQSRQQIRMVLDWISNYFRNNNIPDTIPYTYYIRNSLHDYQFVQDNSFE